MYSESTMADKRLFCLIVAAISLIATTTAKPSANDTEVMELKQLLGAMKRYLQTKTDEQGISNRANAHDDVRTVYNQSSSENAVSAAESAGTGYWTQWINVDKTMEHGTGEFEDCSRIIYEQNKDQKCYLGCKAPLAARYSLVNAQTTATWTDIENCVGPMDSKRVTSCGFTCINADARFADKTNCKRDQCRGMGLDRECARCPNVRVQFFCVGQKPDVGTCCPYSTACSRRSGLRAALSVFGTDVEKRDVIANILYEVQDVLEPTN